MMDTDALHRRPWFRAALIGGALVVVVGLLAGWWFFMRGEPVAPAEVQDDAAAPPTAGTTATMATTPAPDPAVSKDMPLATGPSEQELRDIDDLLTQDRTDEAATRLAALRASYPEDAQVRWREAGLQAQRPDGAAAARTLYAEALRLDPSLARDLGFHAQVESLLREPPIGDAAIDLALALGPQGQSVLVEYINDREGWATYPQRRKIRDALEKVPGAAAQIDQALNARRDLWQVAQSPTPCQTMQAALLAMQARPHVDHVDAIKAATPPAVGAAADQAEKTACGEVEPLLASVRTQYAAAYPASFPKAKKKRVVKKKRKSR